VVVVGGEVVTELEIHISSELNGRSWRSAREFRSRASSIQTQIGLRFFSFISCNVRPSVSTLHSKLTCATTEVRISGYALPKKHDMKPFAPLQLATSLFYLLNQLNYSAISSFDLLASSISSVFNIRTKIGTIAPPSDLVRITLLPASNQS
jgi:hypothetical protein